MKKIFTLIFLVIIFSDVINAQWSNNAAVNNAICTLGGEQAIPKIATCSNGDSYIGYFSNETGNYNIRLQRLDSQGNELWAGNGILISDNTSDSWLTDWDMAADNHDNFIMTWQDIRNGTNNAYAYLVSPEGTLLWGDNGIALSNNSSFNASPKVVCTAAGNAVFAWSSDNVIILQKINTAGEKQWGPNGITLGTANRLIWPQMLPVGEDDIILKYFEDSGPINAPTRHVLAQRYNSAGTPVWASPTVVSDAGGISAWTQIFPFINDGNDGFYIAWHDDRDFNTLASVWVHHINADGVAQYADNGVEATSNSSYNHFYPHLACPSGSTDLYVYWNEMNSLQTLRGLYGQKISSAGAVQWGSGGKMLIPMSSTNIYPLAARNTSSDDMIVFYEESATGVSGSLKAMRIATDGSFVWPGNSATISSVASSKVHTVINEFQNNQWIISWEDDRSGTSDIYAQNMLPDGTLGASSPEYGNIQGQVTLNGGGGDVTQVVVTAGSQTTNPDAAGNYEISVLVGTYNVTASLEGYLTGTVPNVIVIEGETTPNIDFLLEPVATTGFIEGVVTLTGGVAEVSQATITAGSFSAHPNADGTYALEVDAGSYTVIASHPYTDSQEIENVLVEAGMVTPAIDFELNVIRANLVCKAIDQFGGIVNGAEISVTGPEGTYTGTMTEDSLVFVNVPYGIYEGAATISGSDPVYSDTIVGADNHHLIFNFILGASNNPEVNTLVSVSPNPTTAESKIVIETPQAINLTLELFDAAGISSGKREFGLIEKGIYEWPLMILTNRNSLAQGIYLLKIRINNSFITRKLIIQNH